MTSCLRHADTALPPHLTLHTAVDAVELAHELASWVAQRLREGLRTRGQALLVVSGGSTPTPFFEALSEMTLEWSRVRITLADERWLPPTHADSNARLVRTHLLRGRAAVACWCPLGDGQGEPQAAQADLDAHLATWPWPADVVVLGMGSDGHTASWFPGSPQLPQALDVRGPTRCLAVSAPAEPNVPVPRMTMTARALFDARALVVHATGEAKGRLLSQAARSVDPLVWPITAVLRQARVPCHVFHVD